MSQEKALSKTSNHEELIQRAISLSARANDEPGRYGPFGAVVVRDGDGVILGEGTNNMLEILDPTAHGEIVAIRAACRTIGSLNLEGCTLYTSCEPCSMCSTIVWHTGIHRVFYAGRLSNAADLLDKRYEFSEVGKPISERPYKAIQGTPTQVEEAEKIVQNYAKATL